MSSAATMRLPGVSEPEGGNSSSSSYSTSRNMYCLDVRQQPRQARMAGSGEKADRRTVDPPPIVRLRIRRPHARRKSLSNLTDDDLISPTLTHTHFCFASLVPENSEEELYDLAGSKSKYVGGSVVSSLFHLKDQSCFVFPDLSVRTEGRWRFKMSMYEIVEDGVIFCDSVLTDVFQVYSSKRFPGMRQSTELSKSLAQQGLKLRIRRPDTGEHDVDETDSQQPQRKKPRAKPRQRPSLTNASWSANDSPSNSGSVRRASGPADFSHSVPFIAPIGSTTSTPQQRPWTSWNASPSKLDPPYPSTFSHGFPSSRPTSSHQHNHTNLAHDYRRLPQLDERNTAPSSEYDARLSVPRMQDSHAAIPSPSRYQMPPPPPRQSPPNPSGSTFPSTSHFGEHPHAQAPRLSTPPPILAPIRSELPHSINRTPSLKWSDPFETDRISRRKSNESSIRTTTSEEGGGTDATSVPSSEAGGVQDDDVSPPTQKEQSAGVVKGAGSLAMLLGSGASDAKLDEGVSFF